MLAAVCDDINSGGIDAAVPENVGKLCKILFKTVEGACKKMPQVVGENLAWVYIRQSAQIFHFPPDVGSAHRPSVAGNEKGARFDVVLRHIVKQLFLKGLNNQYRARFSFERNRCFSFSGRFNSDELQFADANSRSADRLNQKI